MKSITKDQTPGNFENWKLLANDEWEPSYAGLQNPLKSELHEALLTEQGWVCCYCGREIDLNNSHIEHFRPQSLRPDLALYYENLHASCIREKNRLPPGEKKTKSLLHCGHAKENDFDEEKHISPLEQNCEQRFVFTLNGEILQTAQTDIHAEYMNNLLNLNSPSLCNPRKAALMGVFDPDFIDSVTEEQLRELADAFRQRDAEGHAPNFGHVVARYAEEFAKKLRGMT